MLYDLRLSCGCVSVVKVSCHGKTFKKVGHHSGVWCLGGLRKKPCDGSKTRHVKAETLVCK